MQFAYKTVNASYAWFHRIRFYCPFAACINDDEDNKKLDFVGFVLFYSFSTLYVYYRATHNERIRAIA